MDISRCANYFLNERNMISLRDAHATIHQQAADLQARADLLAEKNEERRAQLFDAIRQGSAVTWVHFNLHGEFDFSDERMVDSVGLALPKNLAWPTV